MLALVHWNEIEATKKECKHFCIPDHLLTIDTAAHWIVKLLHENQAYVDERNIQNDILIFIKVKHTAEYKYSKTLGCWQ